MAGRRSEQLRRPPHWVLYIATIEPPTAGPVWIASDLGAMHGGPDSCELFVIVQGIDSKALTKRC
jgi:hypothetical protein